MLLYDFLPFRFDRDRILHVHNSSFLTARPASNTYVNVPTDMFHQNECVVTYFRIGDDFRSEKMKRVRSKQYLAPA